MIGAVLWRVALLAVAGLAIFVQLDRQSERYAPLASNVPDILRGSSQAIVAANAVSGDDAALGLAEARQLVLRRPLPAENLRLLAQAQVAAGLEEEGSLTVQYAAQRGWRDPLAQEAMLRLAIAAGDRGEAARRYTALFLRRDTSDALLVELGGPIFAGSASEGRDALINIVSGADRWQRQFLRRGARVIPAEAFEEIVRGAAARGTQFDCTELATSARVVSSSDTSAGHTLEEIVAEAC